MERVGDGVAVLREQGAAEARRGGDDRDRSEAGGLLAGDDHGREQGEAARRLGLGVLLERRVEPLGGVVELTSGVDLAQQVHEPAEVGDPPFTRRLEGDVGVGRHRRPELETGRARQRAGERAVELGLEVERLGERSAHGARIGGVGRFEATPHVRHANE